MEGREGQQEKRLMRTVVELKKWRYLYGRVGKTEIVKQEIEPVIEEEADQSYQWSFFLDQSQAQINEKTP